MKMAVYIFDGNSDRARALAERCPEGVTVLRRIDGKWAKCAGDKPTADGGWATILMHHLGDEWPNDAIESTTTLYYGGNGHGDERFHGKGEPVPEIAVKRVPADLAKGSSGWLLQRKISATVQDWGISKEEMYELLAWACPRRGDCANGGLGLPRVLVPPGVGKDESALCALAFLCQCELAAHVKDGASGDVLSALKRAGLVDENGKTVDLSIEWERSAGLRLSAWSLGLGAAPKDVCTEKLSPENRVDVEALLAALGKRAGKDSGGASEVTPIDGDLVARAYLALDRHFGGGAA